MLNKKISKKFQKNRGYGNIFYDQSFPDGKFIVKTREYETVEKSILRALSIIFSSAKQVKSNYDCE